MKRSLPFLSVVFCAAIAWSQTATPPSSTGPSTAQSPASSGQLKVRGPEAVAEQYPDRVVATIGGKPITAKQAMDLLKPLTPQQRKQAEGNMQAVVQQLYMENQLADEAAKMNLDQQSPYKEQLQLVRANVLTQAYIEKLSNSGSGSGGTDPKAYYDNHAAEFDQVKISGILIAFSPPGTPASNAATSRTEAQAQEKANDIEKKLKAGSDLSALARAESDNQQSASQGGALGSFLLGNPGIPPDIKAAIAKLQPGQISEPIRISTGYYIIKLDSRTHASFDQVKVDLTQKLQSEKAQAVLAQEREKYKVQVQDPDFFNAARGTNIPSLQRPAPAATPGSTGTAKPPAQ